MKVPDHIASIKPYVPGKPIEEVERELGIKGIVKLASNENPLGPSPRAARAMEEEIRGVNRYPDGGGFFLRKEISRKFDWPLEGIILGSGSVEIIELLCRAFLQDRTDIVASEGAFIMYKLASQQMNANFIQIPMKDYGHDLPAMADALTPNTPLVFIANPNNPTGTYVNKQEMEDFIDRVPDDIIIVVDEAYFEFIEEKDFPDSLEYLKAGKNIVTLRTFSKIYGLAGLRIGYGFARPEVFDVLNRIRSPFNTSSMAQAAAKAALEDDAFAEQVRVLTTTERAYLEKELDVMGVEYVPSVANFILVDVRRNGKEVFQELLQKGVIVRPVAGYGLPRHLRISIGTHEENVRFIEAFKEVYKA